MLGDCGKHLLATSCRGWALVKAEQALVGADVVAGGHAEANRSSQRSLEGRLLLFKGSAPLLLLLGLLLPLLLLLADLLLEPAGCVHGVDLSKKTPVSKSSSGGLRSL